MDMNAKCPKCGETLVRKAGLIILKDGKYQRYQCINPDCPEEGRVFRGEKLQEIYDGRYKAKKKSTIHDLS